MRRQMGRVAWFRYFLTFSALLAIVAAGAERVSADEKAPNRDEAAAEKSPADLSAATLAARLVLEGENRKSPMLLLAAAEMVGDMKVSARDLEGVTAELNGEAKASGTPLTLNMRALIERAREMAKGNEALAAAVETAIERIESPNRGLVYRQGKDLPEIEIKGIVFKVLNEKNTRLDPGDTYTLSNVIFEARKPAVVLVVGDGDGDLDLWVYDDNGILIGSDVDSTSVCEVAWVPRYEAPFRLVIRNVGTTWERFFVLANW
jgi:hypothetical protein